jgi:hypothetical protein
MKNLKNYYEFMNESSKVPHTIVQYNLLKNKWVEDKELIKKFEDENKDAKNVRVFVTNDKSRDLKYIFTTWKEGSYDIIELSEDGNVIFNERYISIERRHFEIDCKEITGLSF